MSSPLSYKGYFTSFKSLRITHMDFTFTLCLWQLWNSDDGHIREACENISENLQLEYLDFIRFTHFAWQTCDLYVYSWMPQLLTCWLYTYHACLSVKLWRRARIFTFLGMDIRISKWKNGGILGIYVTISTWITWQTMENLVPVDLVQSVSISLIIYLLLKFQFYTGLLRILKSHASRDPDSNLSLLPMRFSCNFFVSCIDP